MDIIINAECNAIPEDTKALVSQESPLLNLLTCLGYDSINPPLAELLSRHYQLEGDWLVLNPVHWQASHNNAVIAAYGIHLELDEQQLKEQFHRFSTHLMSTGMALYYHDPYTWLLSTNHRSLLNAKPTHLIINKPLMFELAQIDETMHWPKFLTESQMFFASLSDSQLINGIWLWGNAPLGEKKNLKICADKTFFSIAQLCSTEVSLYTHSLSLKEFDLLLIDDLSVLSELHHEHLAHSAARWYWNNACYEHTCFPWFTRLWRRLTHAH